MSIKFPISEYFNRIPLFPFAALSPSGEKVAYMSSISGSPQVWVASIPDAGMLEYPKPLTSDKNKRPYVFGESLQWIGDEKLACLFDTEGDEQTFIEIFDLKSGEVNSVPRGEVGSRDFLGFIEKDVLFFTSNRGHLATQGLFTFGLKTGKIEEILFDRQFSASWCSGLKYKNSHLYIVSSANTSNQIFAVNVKTKSTTSIFVFPDTLSMPSAVLKNGNILMTTDHQREFNSPAELNPRTGSLKFLSKDQWDYSVGLSHDEKHFFQNVNMAGKDVVTLKKWPSQKKIHFKISDKGVITDFQFSKIGKHALFRCSSPTEPADLYRVDLKTKKVQKLTDNYVSRIPQSTLVHPELIQYSSQNRKIYSWFFRPKGAKKDGKLPVIVWPHGGPQFQERAQPRPIFQYFLSRGFAIWAPNHSGSTGFGKTFTKLIERAWGDIDLPDMQNGVEWLKKSGWADPDKLVIMGGSYGGYMTLRSIIRMPDIFKAAVDIFGVSNLISFQDTVPEDWKPFMAAMVGDLVKDREMLIRQSPFYETEKIRCPLLVIQGAKDPRVVKAESDQIVEAMKARKQEVEYLVFEDEGHGFFKLENELTAYSRAAEFIERYI
jgi:dienelactone hydrolase